MTTKPLTLAERDEAIMAALNRVDRSAQYSLHAQMTTALSQIRTLMSQPVEPASEWQEIATAPKELT